MQQVYFDGRLRDRRALSRVDQRLAGSPQLSRRSRSSAGRASFGLRSSRRRHHGRKSRRSASLLNCGRPGIPRGRDRRHDARLVQGRRAAASLAGRDPARIHRTSKDEQKVFMGEGAALRRTTHAGRPAGAGAGWLRARPSAHQEMDGTGASKISAIGRIHASHG